MCTVVDNAAAAKASKAYISLGLPIEMLLRCCRVVVVVLGEVEVRGRGWYGNMWIPSRIGTGFNEYNG